MNQSDLITISSIRSVTGVTLRLRSYESIKSYQLSELTLIVCIDTYEVVNTARETRYNRKGWRLVTITRGSANQTRWRIAEEDTIWHDDFEPFIERHIGRVETIEERRDRIEWQTLCHRPGNDQFPLDNAESIDTTMSPKMANHYDK